MGNKLLLVVFIGLLLAGCVSKKEYDALVAQSQSEMARKNQLLDEQIAAIGDYQERLGILESELDRLRAAKSNAETALELREEQITDLKDQITDAKQQRDVQVQRVEDLTTLSKSASDNINQTLSQLEQKDKYIYLLQAARTRADSINLALSANLKQVLKEGIEDKDIDVRVDKTVVFVNLSDKMLFTSGSYTLTPRANEVLGKIATIVQSRPNLEVMVEGYTDNQPISRAGIKDNWDLSVLRSTSVVRALQTTFGVDPNRLIAAGRGEHNALASNDTATGRSINRRTRIIILPKIDEFYELLDPNKLPE
ncbi:MAG: OmpA family protein [Saprospiraceae bacterium]|nr:OmpA family protein [Saprospiraceae bacterium]